MRKRTRRECSSQKSREADVGRTHRDHPVMRASAWWDGLAGRKSFARWRGERWREGETVRACGANLSPKREDALHAVASKRETACGRVADTTEDVLGRSTASVHRGCGRRSWPIRSSEPRAPPRQRRFVEEDRGAPRGASCPTVWSRKRGGALSATWDVRRRAIFGQSSSSRKARGVGIRGTARCCWRAKLTRVRSCRGRKKDVPRIGALPKLVRRIAAPPRHGSAGANRAGPWGAPAPDE